MKTYSISESDQELIYDHAIGHKDGDDLVPHLPCHVYDTLKEEFLYLTGFQGGNKNGFVYTGRVNGGDFRLITLSLKDSLFLLDADPTTFLS